MSDKIKAVVVADENQGSALDLTDWRDIVTILAVTRGKTAFLPAGYPLRSAIFDRKGAHLVIEAEFFRKSSFPDFSMAVARLRLRSKTELNFPGT